jgi:hypothetical protein
MLAFEQSRPIIAEMKRYTLTFTSLLMLTQAATAATVLASYDFADGLGPTSVADGISASGVSVNGATLIFPTLYGGNPSPAVAARNWLGGRNDDRYYGFSVTNVSAATVSVNGITMDLRNESPGTGPTGFAVTSSADGFQTDLAAGTLDWATRAWVHVDREMNFLLGPGQTLEFRVTGWGANSIPPQGGHLLMDNVAVTAVPEPAGHLAMAGLAVGSLLLRRRIGCVSPR